MTKQNNSFLDYFKTEIQTHKAYLKEVERYE